METGPLGRHAMHVVDHSKDISSVGTRDYELSHVGGWEQPCCSRFVVCRGASACNSRLVASLHELLILCLLYHGNIPFMASV